MSGHTKGPWTVENTTLYDGGWLIFSGLYRVAMVPNASEKPENEANARLIAAAPELLAALREAEQFVDRHSEEWYGPGQTLLTQIRAASAKATGTDEPIPGSDDLEGEE